MVNLLSAIRPLLTFWHRYNFQSYKDFGFVEVSTDNRASWKRIYFITGYSGTHWEQAEVDLGPYANKQIWLRFRVITDGSEVYDGWHIDDIEISDNTAALSYPFFDDMESGAGNWILGSWGLVSNGYSGTWCMNDSPDGHTPLYTDNALVLAGEIDLTYAVNLQLTFWQSYYLESTGQGTGIVAQLGYGLDGSDPGGSGWIWLDASYYDDAGDFDRYEASLTIDTNGVYDYAYRFKMDNSDIWAYADLNGNNLGECGTNGYSSDKAGDLTVLKGTIPPACSADVDEDCDLDVFDLVFMNRHLQGFPIIVPSLWRQLYPEIPPDTEIARAVEALKPACPLSKIRKTS